MATAPVTKDSHLYLVDASAYISDWMARQVPVPSWPARMNAAQGSPCFFSSTG